MNSTELVDVVDENDEVVGTYERHIAQRSGLALRVSGILVFSSRSTVFLQRRSRVKSYPLCFDYSAAGHVLSGEEYLSAAHRELKEEIGIEADLSFLGSVRIVNEHGGIKKIHRIFTAKHDGPFRIYEPEVEDVCEFSFERLSKSIAESPQSFTPSFRVVFSELILPSLFEYR